jgi:hypothetical protein
MTTAHPPTRGTSRHAHALIAAITLAGLLVGTPATADSTSPRLPTVIRVVAADGRVQVPSTVVACPYVESTISCADPATESADVGPGGIARLTLDPSTRYDVFAFVRNPDPAWACPGFQIGTDELYLSDEVVTGTGAEIPRFNQLTIAAPSPYDCVAVRVIDSNGAAVAGAGLFVDDGIAPGLTDADGVIRISVEPGQTYDVGAFVADAGWPCPFVWEGTELHFSDRRQLSTDELLAGPTFVVRIPDSSECEPTQIATVLVVDQSGAPVAGAGLFVNGGFAGPTGAAGEVQFVVEPELTYQVGAFLACSAPATYLFSDGNVDISGAALIADGLVLTLVGDVAACQDPL